MLEINIFKKLPTLKLHSSETNGDIDIDMKFTFSNLITTYTFIFMHETFLYRIVLLVTEYSEMRDLSRTYF